MSLAASSGTRFIDASTAHGQRKVGCSALPNSPKGQPMPLQPHKWFLILAVTPQVQLPFAPLSEAGILPPDYPVTINAVSGYTGGGKAMIAQMEDGSRDDAISANHFAYALMLAHKHVPEIMKHATSSAARSSRLLSQVRAGHAGQHPAVHGSAQRQAVHAAIHDALASHYLGNQWWKSCRQPLATPCPA